MGLIEAVTQFGAETGLIVAVSPFGAASHFGAETVGILGLFQGVTGPTVFGDPHADSGKSTLTPLKQAPA